MTSSKLQSNQGQQVEQQKHAGQQRRVWGQRAEEQVQAKRAEAMSQRIQQDVLVKFGSASADYRSCIRREGLAAIKTFARLLRRRATLVMVDKYKTSRHCSTSACARLHAFAKCQIASTASSAPPPQPPLHPTPSRSFDH